jgi:hypothetical protein
MARMIQDLRCLYHLKHRNINPHHDPHVIYSVHDSVPHIPGVFGLSTARSGSVIVQCLEKVVSMMHNADHEFTWGADQVEPAVKVVSRVVRAKYAIAIDLIS